MDTNQLTLAMMEYYNGDPKRIQHFLKVVESVVITARAVASAW